MLRQDSMSTVMAKITRRVEMCGGRVDEDRLDTILREFGITRQNQNYKDKLVEYGYLQYDRARARYCLSVESCKTAKITITVKPSLYAEEVRRHLADGLVGYAGLIEISDVEL